jgi:hypothetical protein
MPVDELALELETLELDDDDVADEELDAVLSSASLSASESALSSGSTRTEVEQPAAVAAKATLVAARSANKKALCFIAIRLRRPCRINHR